jgi:hypothetical protein
MEVNDSRAVIKNRENRAVFHFKLKFQFLWMEIGYPVDFWSVFNSEFKYQNLINQLIFLVYRSIFLFYYF